MNLDPNSMSSRDKEMNMRVREAADKVFKAKFGEQYVRENEILARCKTLMTQVYSLAMQVVNTAAEAGHPFDPVGCSKLIEKLLLDNLNTWNKDELLFLSTLIHTGVLMEQIQEQVDQGLIGKQKDFPV